MRIITAHNILKGFFGICLCWYLILKILVSKCLKFGLKGQFLYCKPILSTSLGMLRLHYVPGGHGSYDFGHRGRNGVTVTQRRGTGSTNVARRGCRDRRDRFLNIKKIATAATAGLTSLNVP